MDTLKLRDYTGKALSECTILELYNAALALTQDACRNRGYNSGKKKVYYISAEFLIGKLLSNNLINLGIYDDVKAELAEAGKDITELEEFEYEPSLGNGGLGRLAACFIDSLATLGLPADGVGLAYHCGLFKQSFEDRKQHTIPDYWRKWGMANWMKRTDKHYKVQCGDLELLSTMYEIDVTGYGSKCGRLRLFDLDTVNEGLIGSGIDFDKKEIEKNLTLFLYPDDSDEDGRLLRVYQEYFMVSNAAQLILDECVERGSNLHDLADYAAIQINDTHPSLVIPELVRLLTEKGIEEKEAYQIVTDVCAYTNHTILAEALETWPKHFFEAVVPHLMPIIKRMNDAVKAKYEEPSVQIIDEYGNVHMAHMDIHYSHSVNGVARLHTDILKETELNNFYKLYPEKFNNKTNGITQRRFLLHANPLLADWITERIGDKWITDLSEVKKLGVYVDDEKSRQEYMNIKYKNKVRLANYILEHNGIVVDPRSIFDVQVKRLHEYKRQLMNILHVMYLYNKIKDNPDMPFYPHTFIFGAKAAAGYHRAKLTIKLINAVADVINNDASINGKIKVVFIEDYCVSSAEIIFAAADVSEQISTASKEASGTSNMKFMLNGAPTLGTMDGANIEIVHEVGEDNAFIFGMSADEVIHYEQNGGYNPMDIFNADQEIRRVLMQLINGFYSPDDPERFRDIYNSLLTGSNGDRPDVYFILKDFRAYAEAHERVDKAYADEENWAKMCMRNTAAAGPFSSDRTIEEYVRDIWHLKKVEVKL